MNSISDSERLEFMEKRGGTWYPNRGINCGLESKEDFGILCYDGKQIRSCVQAETMTQAIDLAMRTL